MADILQFDVFAGSGKGLMARPILPNDAIATKSLIQSITYEIKTMSSGVVVTGTLNPALVMADSPKSWRADKVGRTFLWPLPGELIPAVNESYRIIVTFVSTDIAVPEAGGPVTFVEVWQANTKDPEGDLSL